MVKKGAVSSAASFVIETRHDQHSGANKLMRNGGDEFVNNDGNEGHYGHPKQSMRKDWVCCSKSVQRLMLTWSYKNWLSSSILIIGPDSGCSQPISRLT